MDVGSASRAADAWARLPEHWRCAFRQAWDAYVAGTIPVGAVVVDPRGAIAAQARNRIFDLAAPPSRQIAGSWLAHAELNAIAQIDAERSRIAEGWAVYSTLEPCPLCAGAITVAFRGRITVGYACGDPIGGGIRALTATESVADVNGDSRSSAARSRPSPRCSMPPTALKLVQKASPLRSTDSRPGGPSSTRRASR